jgi:hypothetical protein
MSTDTQAMDGEPSDQELFNSAIADEMAEPVEPAEPEAHDPDPAPEPEPEPAQAEAEDDLGESDPDPEDKGDAKPKGRVPSWRLAEETERKREALERAERAEREAMEVKARFEAMERQFAAMQAPQQPQTQPDIPDPVVDPQAYAAHVESAFERRMQAVQLENNLQLAQYKHGEAFDKAYEAFVSEGNRNPGWARGVVTSSNPGEAIVSWYKGQQVLSQVGDDPSAYTEKVKAETREALAKDPEFRKQLLEELRGEASASGNTTTQLPPSLSKATAASRGGNEPIPGDDELLSSALRR